MAGSASAAEPAPQTVVEQREGDDSPLRGKEGVTVIHWGYDGEGHEWQSKALDASIKRNNNPSDFIPSKIAEQDSAARGFVCSLYVGTTILRGGELEAGTSQTCTGAFLEQWTASQFERSSWTGYRDYSGVSVSDTTYNEVNDLTWTVGCGNGGTYDYRLVGIPWATSSEDGNDVAGPRVYGNSGRHSCGT